MKRAVISLKIRKMKLKETLHAIRVQNEYWVFPSFFYFLAKGLIKGTAYVSIAGDRITGLAIWSGRRLGVITVGKEWQGKGIGTLLLNKTEPKNPWAVTVGDKKVIDFYKKNGYIVTEVRGKKV